MSFEPREYLRHILDEADYLLQASEGLKVEGFTADPTLRRAFVRSLEIIGEATKNLPAAFRAEHPELPWSDMARTRDRLIHGYVDVDYLLVWQAVREHVPIVKRQIEALLSEPQ